MSKYFPARRDSVGTKYSDKNSWAQKFAFWTIAIIFITTICFGKRDTLLDQLNYINYFKQTDYSWFFNLYETAPNLLTFLAQLFTEESGWRIWIIFVNSFGFSPEFGVRLTVVTLNVLIIFATTKTKHPLISLLIWLLVPVGAATIGLFQIRQGFAFSIAMFFALNLKKPIRGAILASLVHTTFLIPASIVILSSALKRYDHRRTLAIVVTFSITLAASAAMLFNLAGGRRAQEYSDLDNIVNPTFLISIIIYSLAPLSFIISKLSRDENSINKTQIYFMHIGLSAYLIACYFLFPFGMTRVAYYSPALLIFTLSEFKLSKTNLTPFFALAMFFMIFYDFFKNLFLGTYDYFF